MAKAGFVALIGRPNVGKSTLLNTIVGQKISIVSDKAQTTRRRLLGIATEDDWQIVFVDTPGFHAPHTELGKLMVNAAQSALAGVDVVLVVIDVSRPPGKEDQAIAQLLRQTGWLRPVATRKEEGKEEGEIEGQEEETSWAPKNVLLCLNKMDLLKPIDVKDHVDAYCDLYTTHEYMLTSLTKQQNVDKLRDLILEHLPEGEPIFDPEQVTDQPMRFLAAEMVREKALILTRQEIPHAIATVVDTWEEPETPGDTLRIGISIVCEKDSQKAILIGKGGSMLREIGTLARADIEEMTGQRVFLELFVKVRADWRQNPRMLHDLDLDV